MGGDGRSRGQRLLRRRPVAHRHRRSGRARNAEQLTTTVKPLNPNLDVALAQPVVTSQPEAHLLCRGALSRHSVDAVFPVALTSGYRDRGRIVGERCRGSGLGSKLTEHEMQCCRPHLGAKAVALVPQSQPGSGFDFAGDREVAGAQALHTDGPTLDHDGQWQGSVIAAESRHRKDKVLYGSSARGARVQGTENGIRSGSCTPSRIVSISWSHSSSVGSRSCRREVVIRRSNSGQ